MVNSIARYSLSHRKGLFLIGRNAVFNKINYSVFLDKSYTFLDNCVYSDQQPSLGNTRLDLINIGVSSLQPYNNMYFFYKMNGRLANGYRAGRYERQRKMR